MKRFLTILTLVISPGVALAVRPAPGVVLSPEDAAIGRPACSPDVARSPRSHAAPTRRLLYVNRYGGTYIGSASNDSSKNHSSIVMNNGLVSGTIPPYPGQDWEWNAMMTCVRELWAPFSIEITEEDPGERAHIEAVVGGVDSDIGMSGAWGVAPYADCVEGILDRAVVFVFAASPYMGIRDACEVLAQEVGHAFALDHEFLCKDPMTYLYGCGNKSFQDVDAPCGEFEADGPWPDCQCGNTTQNTVQHLLASLGPADPVPPTVAITDPQDGATVPLGFLVSVDAADDTPYFKVELWLDGTYVAVDNLAPYTLDTPTDLAIGMHTVEVRALDNGGNTTTASIGVNVTAGCATAAECADGQECEAGVCLNAIGSGCDRNSDCASQLCATDGENLICTKSCATSDECPSGFSCQTAPGGGFDKCLPAGGGGWCEATPGSAGDPHRGAGTLALLGLAALAGVTVLSRRRS